MVVLAAFGTQPCVEEVRAEIAVSAGGVGEQVPDDDEDGAGDRDQGAELADAFGQAAVAGVRGSAR